MPVKSLNALNIQFKLATDEAEMLEDDYLYKISTLIVTSACTGHLWVSYIQSREHLFTVYCFYTLFSLDYNEQINMNIATIVMFVISNHVSVKHNKTWMQLLCKINVFQNSSVLFSFYHKSETYTCKIQQTVF